MCCVRPGVFDAKARRFCWASVLTAVDLPALERPTKAISGRPRGARFMRARLALADFLACGFGSRVVFRVVTRVISPSRNAARRRRRRLPTPRRTRRLRSASAASARASASPGSTPSTGRCLSWLAVVRNRAVCVQASARLPGVIGSVAGGLLHRRGQALRPGLFRRSSRGPWRPRACPFSWAPLRLDATSGTAPRPAGFPGAAGAGFLLESVIGLRGL